MNTIQPYSALYNLHMGKGVGVMSRTKQFRIAVRNHPGAVAEIARKLGNAKVNILALLGTAQGTAGTVQFVVEDSARAKRALDESKIRYEEMPAEQLELPNKAGARWAKSSAI